MNDDTLDAIFGTLAKAKNYTEKAKHVADMAELEARVAADMATRTNAGLWDYSTSDATKFDAITATQIQMQQKMMEQRAEAAFKAMEAEQAAAEEERRRAPQKAMDDFLGGVSYDDALALVKQHYPEKFI